MRKLWAWLNKPGQLVNNYEHEEALSLVAIFLGLGLLMNVGVAILLIKESIRPILG